MTKTIELREVATARSGDKGNHANIGVVAFTEEGFDFLRERLTCEEVGKFLKHVSPSKIERFELPNVWALNFLLYDALEGGASQSLKLDTQGKLLGTDILGLPLSR